ncbi:5-oxoprolinase subunit PxpA [Parasphingorhabdus sp.]|uniref:5-oxoprolinase subunit PxpA n=1 Tax=Parasphingorhabdus sp. TaxID=2709688 RepID=UPI0032667EE9
MIKTIDLNADLGEDESPDGIARDLTIMQVISSCNIACGGHAGSARSMETMLRAAKRHNVSAGAHPSYPDRDNFGRSTMEISAEDLTVSLQGQLRDITAIAQQTAVKLFHLKPHGALYNDAQDDPQLSDLLVALAKKEQLALVGMADTVLADTARRSGIRFIAEAFVDRRYDDHARLVSRNIEGAVIAGEEPRLEQALALTNAAHITTASGGLITVPTETLCLHSDSKGALETARVIRRGIERSGVEIASPQS